MSDDRKPPRFRADGNLDGRGHSEASKATRFGKGDGRKRGTRTKGSRDERTIALKIRDMPVWAIDPSGKRYRANTPEGIMLTQRKKALAGDIKAAEFIMKRLDRYEIPSAEPDRTRALLEEDRIILEAARRRDLTPEIEEVQP